MTTPAGSYPFTEHAEGLTPDQELAARLAAEAGLLLLEIRDSHEAGKELGNTGDRRADDHLLARLAEERPDDAVLSEESPDGPERIDADRVWIIDPVDGTREYSSPPRPDWAVHVALWERAGDERLARLTASAVALPGLGVVHHQTGDLGIVDRPAPGGTAVPAAPAALLDERTDERPRLVKSASRPPEFLAQVAEAVGGVQVPLGSAGAKAMSVVRGEADAYIHAGGQYQWDSAAPAGVALARGFHASRVDGSPLVYNAADRYLPDLLICRADLAEPILDALSRCRD